MHCQTEIAVGKARADQDIQLYAANKLQKGKGDGMDYKGRM